METGPDASLVDDFSKKQVAQKDFPLSRVFCFTPRRLRQELVKHCGPKWVDIRKKKMAF